MAVTEMQLTVVKVAALMWFVGAGRRGGRQARFMTDFAWEVREGRAAPAARNAAHFKAAQLTRHGPAFEVTQP